MLAALRQCVDAFSLVTEATCTVRTLNPDCSTVVRLEDRQQVELLLQIDEGFGLDRYDAGAGRRQLAVW